MAKIISEEARLGHTLDRGQGGERFVGYSGSHYLRHAQITSWWERILAVITLALVAFTLGSILLRTLWG
jgi:hypothetical protein